MYLCMYTYERMNVRCVKHASMYACTYLLINGRTCESVEYVFRLVTTYVFRNICIYESVKCM